MGVWGEVGDVLGFEGYGDLRASVLREEAVVVACAVADSVSVFCEGYAGDDDGSVRGWVGDVELGRDRNSEGTVFEGVGVWETGPMEGGVRCGDGGVDGFAFVLGPLD